MSVRVNNWPAKLALFLEEKRNQPFVWGQNDCCLFAADWVAMLTGVDPAGILGLRGTYNSALSAVRILMAKGGVEEIASTWCTAQYTRPGWESETRPVNVGRGGIVSLATEPGYALGVAVDSRAAFASTNGIVLRNLGECARGWRIQ